MFIIFLTKNILSNKHLDLSSHIIFNKTRSFEKKSCDCYSCKSFLSVISSDFQKLSSSKNVTENENSAKRVHCNA